MNEDKESEEVVVKEAIEETSEEEKPAKKSKAKKPKKEKAKKRAVNQKFWYLTFDEIIDCLKNGYTTDEEISEKTNCKLNIVRKILYKLYDMRLASYKRDKDKETQWYTYFDTIFVQNEQSRELLAGIGLKDNVIVAGDTRFDRVADVRAAAREFPLVQKFVGNSPFTLVMGSSWPPDEDIVIPYFNAHREMKLIIAPHEFDRHRLHVLMSKLSRPARFYSETTPQNITNADCLIIDSFGLLSSLYRYGQAAYVGGGFGAGIHNINEAAVYGIPVIFGPKYHKFQEATDLIAVDGAMSIHDADSFSAAMDPLLENEPLRLKCGKSAGDYIQSHLGGTQLIYDTIF